MVRARKKSAEDRDFGKSEIYSECGTKRQALRVRDFKLGNDRFFGEDGLTSPESLLTMPLTAALHLRIFLRLPRYFSSPTCIGPSCGDRAGPGARRRRRSGQPRLLTSAYFLASPPPNSPGDAPDRYGRAGSRRPCSVRCGRAMVFARCRLPGRTHVRRALIGLGVSPA